MNATHNRETQAVIDMANDVFAEHTAEGCCTAAAPCTVVAYYQAQLAKYATGRSERSEPDPEPERAGHRPAAGAKAANQFGTFAVKYATDKQRWFVAKCLQERDLTGLTDRNAGIIAKAQAAVAAGQISKRHASDALDILTTLPYVAGAAVTGPKLASEKQVALIVKLAHERVLTGLAAGDELKTEAYVRTLTSKAASQLIDSLFGFPKLQAAQAPAAVLESGIYAVGDKVYKVYWNQARTHMLAKLLVLGIDGEKASWDYQGAASRFVKAEQRMTLEQAKAFGAIYGVCCNCGATLTDETSIEAGIGPVCAGRFA